MCGIAGIIEANGRPVNRDRLVSMAGKITHRGPDGDGIWTDGQAGLAHRRLAIVDLSPNGAQPMLSQDGRYSITFNGEIYNYQELREQLAESSEQLRSTSDTEVLLALYAKEGESMLSKLRGMFAFAIWDKQESRLFFARDRIGKKPFFYRNNENGFAFASEVKALVDQESQIDELAIRLFLGLQYVPSPLTGFKNIFSLEPGMCGTWKDGKLEIKRYLSVPPPQSPSFSKAGEEVRELLEESVRLRLIADVPVGIFLSGGIDSSAVAAIAHKQGAKLSSFTLGFDEAAFDERDQAMALAKQFGFEHHSFLAKPEDLLAIADEVIEHYDVPYADSSSLNTWILARETKKHVKAVLTGDGGDELFGGYRRYGYFEQALNLKKMGLSRSAYRVARSVGSMTGNPKFQRFADTIDGGYAALFCGAYFQQPEAIDFINGQLNKQIDPIGAAMDFDLHSYLPDDLNVKMDRATMRHGLEARCPLLDQELVSYVTSLPTEYRYTKGKTKALLVDAVKDILPSEVGKRPKRGFQVPLATWFRGPLRAAFVERCMQSAKLHAYVARDRVEQLLKENDRGSDHGNRLWMLYSLATWLEKYG
jgi:asparagine synthase (glutamine-hydrolysing)